MTFKPETTDLFLKHVTGNQGLNPSLSAQGTLSQLPEVFFLASRLADNTFSSFPGVFNSVIFRLRPAICIFPNLLVGRLPPLVGLYLRHRTRHSSSDDTSAWRQLSRRGHQDENNKFKISTPHTVHTCFDHLVFLPHLNSLSCHMNFSFRSPNFFD